MPDETIGVFEYRDNQLTYHLDNKTLIREELLGYITNLHEALVSKGWGTITPEEATDEILNCNLLLRVGQGLIATSIIQEWFSDDLLLVEEAVYDVHPKDMVPAMEALGRFTGCTHVAVGTRAVSRDRHLALARLFQNAGMHVSTIELRKQITYEVNHEQSL